MLCPFDRVLKAHVGMCTESFSVSLDISNGTRSRATLRYIFSIPLAFRVGKPLFEPATHRWRNEPQKRTKISFDYVAITWLWTAPR